MPPLQGGVPLANFFFSSRRRHTRCGRDWSSDVCSSDLKGLSVLVSGSLTIPMVPPVYMISNFCSTFCLNNEILFLQLKQLLRIGGSAVRNVLCLPSENFGQLIAHLHQVGRLVPLAAVGHRRQVGRIRLQ